MAQTIGSLDLNAFSDLYSDSTQYFWFEGNASASYGAGAHVTLVPDTTFISNPTGQNILMNTDGFSIRNGLLPMMTLDNDSLDFNVVDTTSGTYVNVASFGDTTTIGVADGTQAYMFLNYRSIQGIDKEGKTYFYVSDLRDANGEYSAQDTFIGDGVTTVFALGLSVFSNLVVKVNDVEQTINVDYTYDSAHWRVTFTSPPANDTIINVTYISRNQNAKAYTFGNRVVGSVIGGMSIAEGRLTTASGYASHAEGMSTVSSGSYSHAEGNQTTASGFSSHAEGNQTTASGYSSHAEGGETIASKTSAHAEGNVTTASGEGAHAEGLRSVASGLSAHAEGNITTASGQSAHAEGMRTVASGFQSHAEGTRTTASGQNAHAEGNQTTASGSSSHAEGGETEASGQYSHAGGFGTIAGMPRQTVIGQYNIEDEGDGGAPVGSVYPFIIGNGTSDTARSNALTVDWNGNVKASGGLTLAGNTSQVGTTRLITDTSSNITATAGSSKTLLSTTLDKGVWIVVCQARFAPSASGANYTAITFGTTAASTGWLDRRHTNGTNNTQHNLTTIVQVLADGTSYYLSGTTATAGTWNRSNANACSIEIVRIV